MSVSLIMSACRGTTRVTNLLLYFVLEVDGLQQNEPIAGLVYGTFRFNLFALEGASSR